MSRRVTDTALAILYLVCALTAQSSRFGIIRGKALDERGRPISGAKVNAEPEDSRPKASAIQFAETDANGRFLLQHLEWGTYKVFGQKESDGYPNLNFAFYSDNRFPRVTLGPKLPIAEITLHLGPPAAR